MQSYVFSDEDDDKFYTTEITSQFREAFPALYAEYDEQEVAKKKKKKKPIKQTPGLSLVYRIIFVIFIPVGISTYQHKDQYLMTYPIKYISSQNKF